jgi:hypothetical protein
LSMRSVLEVIMTSNLLMGFLLNAFGAGPRWHI